MPFLALGEMKMSQDLKFNSQILPTFLCQLKQHSLRLLSKATLTTFTWRNQLIFSCHFNVSQLYFTELANCAPWNIIDVLLLISASRFYVSTVLFTTSVLYLQRIRRRLQFRGVLVIRDETIKKYIEFSYFPSS